MKLEQGEKVLLVEDNISSALVYRSYMEPEYEVTVAYTGQEAQAAFVAGHFAAAVIDIHLPDTSGLALMATLIAKDPGLPVIIMTSDSATDVVVEAMRLGARDFLAKPFDKARLRVTLNNCLKARKLTAMVEHYEKTATRQGLHNMIGASLPMQAVYQIIESAASSRATVFITGESGTGKELCAEAIHRESNRSSKPWVALNCAAIPRDLIESEIFGHTKGAFTGAVTSREGAASRAHGGTLFLDEIGEMPLDMQSKLLRLLQSGTFTPVGSSKEFKVDIRFICATNRDPLEEVARGRFREDLYYRLHVIPIQMPALRERGKDCLLIANRLLKEFSADEGKSFKRFDDETQAFMLRYPWPGNVRELSNVVRNIIVLNDAEVVTLPMLPAMILDATRAVKPQEQAPAPVPDAPPVQAAIPAGQEGVTLNDLQYAMQTKNHHEQIIRPLWLEEKEVIERAIAICGGNIPKAAAFLDISASTIYRKKQQWESASPA